MNEEIETELKQSENRLKWAKFWRSTIQWMLKLLKISSLAAVGAASGYSGAYYYVPSKPAEIAPQKVSTPKTVVKREVTTQVIHDKIDYSKVQDMINKALQAHIREYHQ